MDLTDHNCPDVMRNTFKDTFLKPWWSVHYLQYNLGGPVLFTILIIKVDYISVGTRSSSEGSFSN